MVFLRAWVYISREGARWSLSQTQMPKFPNYSMFYRFVFDMIHYILLDAPQPVNPSIHSIETYNLYICTCKQMVNWKVGKLKFLYLYCHIFMLYAQY